MKVTVKDYLNVRVGKPSLNADCYKYLRPGHELEVDGKLYKGDMFEGIDTWLKDDAGNHYWSGGVINRLPWWIEDFGIDEIWKSTRGENAVVILLDSGFTECEDVSIDRIQLKYSVIQNDTGLDSYGHGTTMSSIICGKGLTIMGIAPACKLIHIKICEDSAISNLNFIEGLKKIEDIVSGNISQRYVVNCSLVLTNLTGDEKKTITQKIDDLASKNVIFSVAAGNRPTSLPTFLESLDSSVVSSAGICKNENNLSYSRIIDSNIWEKITVTTPGYYPALKQFTLEPYGSSHACAYTSGLIALTISLKPDLKITEFKSLISKCAQLCPDVNSDPNFIINNKIISRTLLVQTLKNL